MLIEKSATLDLVGKSGRTPLSYAAEKGRTEVVKTLIDNGAAVDVLDEDSREALHKLLQCHEE